MKITQTRNRFWMSKTAKREQDWKYKLRTIRTKDDQEKFLRHMKRNKQAPL